MNANRRTTLLSLVLAIGLVAILSSLIYWNAESRVAEHREPMPVAVTPFVEQPGYTVTRQFVGTAQPYQTSRIGFELSGTVDSVAVRAGDLFEAGATLAALNTDRRRTQYQAALASLERAQADALVADNNAERAQSLFEQGLISISALEDARRAQSSTQAGVSSAQAGLENAQLELDKSALRAPFRGMVIDRLVDEGAQVNPGMPVLVVETIDAQVAQIGLPIDIARSLTVGQSVPLVINQQRISAPVRAIKPVVDAATLSAIVEVVLPERVRAASLELVRLELSETVPTAGGWLPLSALLAGERGLWSVLAIMDSPGGATTVREHVEVIYASGDRVFVRGTLPSGARVIATGLQRLSPGTRVTPLSESAE